MPGCRRAKPATTMGRKEMCCGFQSLRQIQYSYLSFFKIMMGKKKDLKANEQKQVSKTLWNRQHTTPSLGSSSVRPFGAVLPTGYSGSRAQECPHPLIGRLCSPYLIQSYSDPCDVSGMISISTWAAWSFVPLIYSGLPTTPNSWHFPLPGLTSYLKFLPTALPKSSMWLNVTISSQQQVDSIAATWIGPQSCGSLYEILGLHLFFSGNYMVLCCSGSQDRSPPINSGGPAHLF